METLYYAFTMTVAFHMLHTDEVENFRDVDSPKSSPIPSERCTKFITS